MKAEPSTEQLRKNCEVSLARCLAMEVCGKHDRRYPYFVRRFAKMVRGYRYDPKPAVKP